MFSFQLIAFAALVAVARAGVLGPVAYGAPSVAYGAPSVAIASPAITSQASNILRTPGNLGQISTYSKSIDTPFSSVRKSDVRVSNDALVAAAPAYAAYHAPAVAAYHAPAVAAVHAPVAAVRAAPAGLLGVAYSAAPAVAHMSFVGLGAQYVY